MRRALLLSALIALPSPAVAQPVYRCEDARGQRIFSDQPCHKFGALALPADSDPPPAPPNQGEPMPAPDAAAEAERDSVPPPEAAGCPGQSPEALAEALRAAAEQADLNALAGLFHWPAAGRGAAGWVFAIAERLAQAAPLQVTLQRGVDHDAWLWAGLPPPAPDQASLPELQAAPAASADAVLARFRLVRHAGCVWLLPR